MNDDAMQVEAKEPEAIALQLEVLEPEALDVVGGGAFPFIQQ